MPKKIAPLTDIQVKNAKPKDKPYKLADGGGLYLEVIPTGGKLWRMKFRQASGKENRLSFGAYPVVTLIEARKLRDTAKKHKADGIDPGQAKRDKDRLASEQAAQTFEKLAREWHTNKLPSWKGTTAKDTLRRLEIDIFPEIGAMPIGSVTHQHMIAALRKIEVRGAQEVAHRLKSTCSRVFSYANQQGITNPNPAADLRDVLKPVQAGHFAAITSDELPAFLAAMDKNDARLFKPTRIAMHLMMLVFVRTSELIEATWPEIDLEAGEWVIPWQRMKRGKLTVNPDKANHHVCLSRQALELLRELHTLTGGSTYLFPNQRDPKKPMSNGAILAALKRMGYQNKMTGHGFRALAMSTIKERLGYRHEVVDRQLAHAQKDKIASAYDRAQFLDERKKMMQEWADYLDVMARGGKVIHALFKAA
ncbi:integrase arm-type DNA-binding domain-containing protein [Herbaspirillum sp. RTI4]|uniref:tyrosine-type recombinase/integrase n=1 Tax=Herbaspirillum sp. RTI4 TaxID=3048640 RepID=UPI002AB5330B|nr:integrase arm-type DNA-binding domain-containing protein [Herbaspirillum sp. RTI4]MDY7579446.1 integrase arm-type DNA-binding domain-containing protein [Herbaspirillum sp. RTI4]MEA9980360.1 integrase arm-type DNA-binding domain-containing protein [Herbaspirillum sp. RTI4]